MKQNDKAQITPLIYPTHLAIIRNSLGSKIFRNLYASVNGKKLDIMENGNLSCAFFVSSILTIEKLIKEIHGTVDGTIKDLEASGWEQIKKPKLGSVIVWEKIDFGIGGEHKHIGFFVGKNEAISNNLKYGYPKKHHYTYKGKRKIEKIFHHEKLK